MPHRVLNAIRVGLRFDLAGTEQMPSHTSFDDRIVRYEEIHSVRSEDFRSFVDAAQIRGKCRVLDCGCGYGAVSREVLLATEHARLEGETELAIDLIDESAVQLERARHELQAWLHVPGIQLRFVRGLFPDDLGQFAGQYDVFACKMVLHEISKEQQLSFLDNAYLSLKQNGRLVLWDVCLSPDIAAFYRCVIRAKDELAGYETMVQRRNFLTEQEIKTLFEKSRFRSFEFAKDIFYRFDTHKRFLPEFQGSVDRFAQWEDFIRKSALALTPRDLHTLQYYDDGESIQFTVRKIIVLAWARHDVGDIQSLPETRTALGVSNA